MVDYHPNQHEEIRRKYLLWGPHQPRSFTFPYREIGKNKKRRFNPKWFDQYANWLEYSRRRTKPIVYAVIYLGIALKTITMDVMHLSQKASIHGTRLRDL
jgi:hypothetical protein